MLDPVEPKQGKVFDGTNLRKLWQKACVASGLGTLDERKYTGLTIHDLRRSAARNLRKAGVLEGVAMKITGHKTRAIFDRYDIVDELDVVEAMRKRQNLQQNLVGDGERLVKESASAQSAKRLRS